jgi:hypothetical protein
MIESRRTGKMDSINYINGMKARMKSRPIHALLAGMVLSVAAQATSLQAVIDSVSARIDTINVFESDVKIRRYL